ncbi:MAG: molecular chaperone SurA [Burkholderiales bacterium PBB4]|nr:MAG: molecular chaperone SurA [Burkholderiales bacterium PBB4]
MKIRIWKPVFCMLASALSLVAHGQSAQQADYIVAVVNSEPITESELRLEINRIRQENAQQPQAVPPPDELRKLVVERLIGERAQLQVARETGIRVDESNIDQAEQSVARQNQIDVPELRRRLAKDGIALSRFRGQLRDQFLLSRLREREVEGRLRISDQDVDRALAEELARATDPAVQEVNLAQILIAVPEKATTEVRAARQELAQKTLERLRAGASFEQLVVELSAADTTSGGQLGLRRGDRFPPLFLEATLRLPVGGVSDVVRSDAGFHILKVIERKAPTPPSRAVVQTRARHILLRPNAQLSAQDATARLADFKKQVESGKAMFENLARDNSQDGSAAQGGDLGWAAPGLFVPEFEEVMNRLAEGKVSEPFASRFGMHIMQVVDRKRVELTPAEVREQVRAQLRESRYDEAYTSWARDVRGRAFVELREPPL